MHYRGKKDKIFKKYFENLLRNLTKSYMQAQQIVVQINQNTAKEVLGFESMGFSLLENRLISISEKNNKDLDVVPLSDMVSSAGYGLTELLIRFGIISEENPNDKTKPFFRIVSFNFQAENIQPAYIKITGFESIKTELFVSENFVLQLKTKLNYY